MKKIYYLVYFVFALTMSVSSCKKDETTSGETLSTADQMKKMLTAQPWTMISKIENADTIAIIDCERDDVYTFSVNGTFSHQVGTLICNGETNSSGTWTLSLDASTFTLDYIPMEIKFTNSKLVISRYTYNPDFDESIITDQMSFIPKQAI
jgi:hypothetical protein